MIQEEEVLPTKDQEHQTVVIACTNMRTGIKIINNFHISDSIICKGNKILECIAMKTHMRYIENKITTMITSKECSKTNRIKKIIRISQSTL